MLLGNYFLTLILFSGVIIEAMAPRVTQNLPKWLATAIKQPRGLNSYVPKSTFGTVSPIGQRSLLPTMRSSWLQQGYVNRASIRSGGFDTSLFTSSQQFKNYGSQRTSDQGLLRILAAAGVAAGAYLLTEQDKKVLAEEAVPLEELAQKDNLLYTVTQPYPDKTEISVTQNGIKVASVQFNSNSHQSQPCYIDALWVDQSFRGKGFGTILLNSAIKSLENDGGCHKIYLWAHPFNLRAGERFEPMLEKVKKYYERFGFRDYPKKTNYMKYRSSNKAKSHKHDANDLVEVVPVANSSLGS